MQKFGKRRTAGLSLSLWCFPSVHLFSRTSVWLTPEYYSTHVSVCVMLQLHSSSWFMYFELLFLHLWHNWWSRLAWYCILHMDALLGEMEFESLWNHCRPWTNFLCGLCPGAHDFSHLFTTGLFHWIQWLLKVGPLLKVGIWGWSQFLTVELLQAFMEQNPLCKTHGRVM